MWPPPRRLLVDPMGESLGGEAENSSQGLMPGSRGVFHALRSFSLELQLSLHTDSSRRGAGKSTRHIQTRMLRP